MIRALVLTPSRKAADEIRELRLALGRGDLDGEAAQRAFEVTVYKIDQVSAEEERDLVSLVNAVEVVRCTRLPENQVAAISEVLERAEEFCRQ